MRSLVKQMVSKEQLVAVKSHEKTEQARSLSLVCAIQLKLGKQKLLALHRRMFMELKTKRGA